MSADQYSERTLGKKLEWRALIGDHHQHAGGRLDGRTFQLEAGASLLETEFGNPDGGIAACTAADGAAPAHQRTSPAVAVDTPPSSAHANNQRPRQRQLGASAVAPAPSDACNVNMKGIVPRQSSSAGLSVGKRVIEWTAGRAGRGGTAAVSLTVRATGTKDRHSKVKTAKGLRDRRVRLSAPTAIQFFDVQDRLGYDQPSKAVDWLIKKARPAIDELAPLEGVVVGDGGAAAAHQDAGKEMGERRDRTDLDDPSITAKEEEQRSSGGGVVGTLGGARAESRAKARERARERAKEKSICTGTETPAPTSVAPAPTPPASAPPAPPYPSSPNLQLLPEILFLSQLCQHSSQPPLFDQHHHHHLLRSLQPSDFSSSFAILQQPNSIATPAGNSATHLLPYASHLFHMAAAPPPTSASSFVFHDVPPLHFSAPPIYNTPISPRGTLQSIFSNPVSSVPQVPMPPHVMGLQQGYGAAPGPSGYGVEGGGFHGTADVVAAGLHQNSGFPLRIHGMELDPHEETRMPPSSMADFQ